MSTIQRRFSVFFGAALLAMALAAPSAFAVADFPHEEDPSKWTAVAVVDYNGSIPDALPCDKGAPKEADCSFSGTGTSCKTVLFGVTSSCTPSLAGDLGYKGELIASSSPLGKEATGLICRHTVTHEYWLRLEGADGGVMFGYLGGDASSLGGTSPVHPRTISFGVPGGMTKISGGSGALSYFGATFNSLWSEKELLMGAYGTEPCGWAEL